MVHRHNTQEEAAAEAFRIQWDFTLHITKYAHDLDKQQKLCRDIGVAAEDATKIQLFVESMYASKMFDDKEMQVWESKTEMEKTWGAAKTHFVALYKSKEKFNAEREACTGGFESANSVNNSSNISFISTTTPTSAITTTTKLSEDHQNLIKYTNSLETALNDAKVQATSMSSTQNKLLKQLQAQQTAMMEQTNKLMAMMHSGNLGSNKNRDTSTSTGRQQEHTRKTAVGPRYCNSRIGQQQRQTPYLVCPQENSQIGWCGVKQ